MTMFTEVLTSLPWGVHVGLGLILAAGVVIWAFGKHLLKPTLVLAAMAMGASVGFVAAAFMPEHISVLWPVGGGVIVFALVALAAYRFVMAAMLAVSLGLACPLGYFTYAEITGLYRDQPGQTLSDEELRGGSEDQKSVQDHVKDAADKASDAIGDIIKDNEDILSGDGNGEGGGSGGDDNAEATPGWRNRFNRMMRDIARELANNWRDAPGIQQTATVLASFAGIALGIVFGIMAPKLSGAVVTALVGSLVILGSGSLLGLRYAMPVEALGLATMTGKLAWWFGLSLLGLLIQFKWVGRKADKKN
ncbi:MAG: hypothetical protein D8M59_01050 [Planctomycetes bacterium]|nr:hypothetical protein [Planctomycetota bacterium]NOG54692.1 hypothetical protein [Planctomycetota bacterium]